MSVPRCALGPGGAELSRLVLGAWRLADAGLAGASLRRLVESAVDVGITSVDHADIYGGYACEELFGDALAAAPGLRDRLELVSKCGIRLVSPARPAHRAKTYDTSAAHITTSVERSLANLRTDRLDLLLLHRPDPLLDADEVAGAFRALHDAGKVRAFGVSNFTPGQVDLVRDALGRVGLPLVANQVEVSPLRLEPFLDGTLDQCQRLGVRAMAWSPLGGGRLLASDDAQAARVRASLAAIGAAHGGLGADVVALAWLLRHPSRMAVVLGTTRPERVAAAAAACAVALDRDAWFDVWCASTGVEVP